jgi:hypothetical protein
MKSWKTTFAGIAGLIAVAGKAVVNPASLADPGQVASIALAIGLLLARDGGIWNHK